MKERKNKMNKMKSSTLHCFCFGQTSNRKTSNYVRTSKLSSAMVAGCCCRQLPLLSSLLLLVVLQFCVKTTDYSVAVATLPSLSPPTLPLFLSTAAAAASDASTCSRVSELSFLSLQCLNVSSSSSLVLTWRVAPLSRISISLLLLFGSLLFVVKISKRD